MININLCQKQHLAIFWINIKYKIKQWNNKFIIGSKTEKIKKNINILSEMYKLPQILKNIQYFVDFKKLHKLDSSIFTLLI
jgi:hypothetical protein